MFWISIENEAESESTSTRWMLRSSAGSAQISSVVRSGPMPASDTLTATFRLAGKPTAASRGEPRNTRRGSVMPSQVDVVVRQIGAGQAAHGLASDHRDRMDLALGGGGDRVQSQDGAGRHDDLGAVLARQFDRQVGVRSSAPSSAPPASCRPAARARPRGTRRRRTPPPRRKCACRSARVLKRGGSRQSRQAGPGDRARPRPPGQAGQAGRSGIAPRTGRWRSRRCRRGSCS